MARFRSGNYDGVIAILISQPAQTAFLMFEGQLIDQLDVKGKTERVVLRQPGEPEQVAQAQWTAAIDQNRPRLSLRIPSIQEALNGIEPAQSFELLVRGRTVFKGDWVDGARARTNLAECSRK